MVTVVVATDATAVADDGILKLDVALEALTLLTVDLADITGNGERLALCGTQKYKNAN